ncbi:MAG: hypothetical protein ABI835_06620 [Chloroflexota bacterium]
MSNQDELLNTSINLRRRQVMKSALVDGIFTDHMADGTCEQLRKEGWLERAAAIAPRPHVSRAPAYLPTPKAENTWNNELEA